MNRDIVLINGWGMSAAIWQPLAAARPEGCRLHCIDLHELSSGGAGIGALAAAAARRSPRECDVIAWSLGAQVALQWAVQDAAGPRPGEAAGLGDLGHGQTIATGTERLDHR